MSVFLQGLDRNANDKAIQDIFANLSIEATVERQNNKRFAIAKLADESKVDEAVEISKLEKFASLVNKMHQENEAKPLMETKASVTPIKRSETKKLSSDNGAKECIE